MFSEKNLQWVQKQRLGDGRVEENKSKWTRIEFVMFLIDVICSWKKERNILLPVDVIEDSDTSTQNGNGGKQRLIALSQHRTLSVRG